MTDEPTEDTLTPNGDDRPWMEFTQEGPEILHEGKKLLDKLAEYPWETSRGIHKIQLAREITYKYIPSDGEGGFLFAGNAVHEKEDTCPSLVHYLAEYSHPFKQIRMTMILPESQNLEILILEGSTGDKHKPRIVLITAKGESRDSQFPKLEHLQMCIH